MKKKIGLKKFLHFKKELEFNSLKYLCKQKMQFAKHVLTKCPAYNIYYGNLEHTVIRN